MLLLLLQSEAVCRKLFELLQKSQRSAAELECMLWDTQHAAVVSNCRYIYLGRNDANVERVSMPSTSGVRVSLRLLSCSTPRRWAGSSMFAQVERSEILQPLLFSGCAPAESYGVEYFSASPWATLGKGRRGWKAPPRSSLLSVAISDGPCTAPVLCLTRSIHTSHGKLLFSSFLGVMPALDKVRLEGSIMN